MQTILNENAYLHKYHIPGGDDVICIETYPYNELTFPQFRELSYSALTFGYSNRGEMLCGYTRERKQMQSYEKTDRKHMLTELLDSVCEWASFPKYMKSISFTKARWLYSNGNWKAFVADIGVGIFKF